MSDRPTVNERVAGDPAEPPRQLLLPRDCGSSDSCRWS
jgi:hypothetical protein